jgi:hypothetical protein
MAKGAEGQQVGYPPQAGRRSPDPTVFWGVVGETPTLLRRAGQSGRQARPALFGVNRAVRARG